jgi:hypothetical protein
MAETHICDNCHREWTTDQLWEVKDFWSRIVPGGVIPSGDCPDDTCGALCYPTSGYVATLEQQHRQLRESLGALLGWAQTQGGWEAVCWRRARRVYAATRKGAVDGRAHA